MLFVFAYAAITKCHRLGGLNRHSVFIVLEVGKSKVRVGLLTGEVLLPGLQTAAFSRFPHVAETGESWFLSLL